MTSDRVRVFRTDGKIEQGRIAVWSGEAWVELETDSVQLVDGPDGALASIILSVHVGHDLRSPTKFDVPAERARERFKRIPQPELTRSEPDGRISRGRDLGSIDPTDAGPALDDAGVGRGDMEKQPPLPVWGDEAKPRVRFFTITDKSGKVYPNNATDVAGSDAKAAEYVRARWNKLASGVSGREAAKVELQPDGRVGTDRPDVAPPRGAQGAHPDPQGGAELDGPAAGE